MKTKYRCENRNGKKELNENREYIKKVQHEFTHTFPSAIMKDFHQGLLQFHITDKEEKWSNNIKINKVLLQLKGKDKGPVHINIETLFSSDFSVKTLPEERAIMKFYNNDKLPNIKAQKVCIFVGSHSKFTMELQNAIDEFCEKFNAIVLCDQTSNYKGK